MAYIGKTPVVGNFQVCDAISVVNGQAAYTLQVGGANVIPESANHMIVSLNGVIQKPGSSFTVSGSTMTFASNLATGDSIDFVQILGNVLDIGTPSDATVTTAKLAGALVTPSTLDVNGNELILDADADTSITADTDDQIDFKTGGTDRLTIKNDGIGIGVTSASAPLEVRTNLSSDTQSTPETVLTLATKFASTSSNGAAGSGSRLEFQIPDDETNPITGAAIAGLKENADDSNAEAALAFYISQNDTTLDEAMRIDSSGNVGIGVVPDGSVSQAGIEFAPEGYALMTRSGNTVLYVNRLTNDGTVISIRQDTTEEGGIDVSGSTVSFNGFTGTHWSRFQDNSTPTILRGTVLESLDEMCDWYNLHFDTTNEQGKTISQVIPHVLEYGQSDGDIITYNHEGTDYQATITKEADIKHMKSKVSDTVDAKNVYGVFSSYDNNYEEGYNDFYVASVGSFVVRIKANETIAKGDLLQSNGDGTAKVQTDDNVKSSSFAKVLSTTIIETYEDGSFIVPCSLRC